MTITAADVNKLRKQTGAGLMDCKKALQESGGDFDEAIEFLRKKGQKISAKRADREATEGVVIATTTDDHRKGFIVHITSETDFVAKNQEFIDFAQKVAGIAVSQQVSSKEDLLAQQYDDITVKDKLDEQVGKIGEKIEIGSFEKLESELVIPYIHAGYKIGVLVGLNKNSDELTAAGKDMAMQIAAMNPISVDESNVPEDVKEKEMEIGREQARAEGKPDPIIGRIAEGKLKKFYKENTLLNQQFVKDSKKTVGEMLKEVDNEAKVTEFKRVALG